jgi:hypothetical protein
MLLHTSSASATKAQCENTHGHDTAALSAVDVGVICENVGDGLRGVRLESHCDVVVKGWLCREYCLIDIAPTERVEIQVRVATKEGNAIGTMRRPSVQTSMSGCRESVAVGWAQRGSAGG